MARSSIRVLMIAVLFSAVILVALRETTDLWAGAILLGVLAASGIIGMSALNLRRNERYRRVGDALCAFATYIASLAFPIPFLGFGAFAYALETLVRSIRSPASAFAGDWLVGLSWLANPAVWAAMVFLLVGKARLAAWSGVAALSLAACALRPVMLCQYIWLASMAYVVYAALRIPDEASAANNRIRAALRLPKIRPVFYPAVALPMVFGLLLLLLSARGLIKSATDDPEFDPNNNVHTGEDAKLRILDSAARRTRPGTDKPEVPASASNFWLYESGSFSGSSTYWTFDCGSQGDCLKAVENLGGLRRDELSPWQPSRYAVIMEGPAFYSRRADTSKKLRANPWDVRGIKDGLLYELAVRDDNLYYYAIDLDRNRVYHACELGGFPAKEYQPTGQ